MKRRQSLIRHALSSQSSRPVIKGYSFRPQGLERLERLANITLLHQGNYTRFNFASRVFDFWSRLVFALFCASALGFSDFYLNHLSFPFFPQLQLMCGEFKCFVCSQSSLLTLGTGSSSIARVGFYRTRYPTNTPSHPRDTVSPRPKHPHAALHPSPSSSPSLSPSYSPSSISSPSPSSTSSPSPSPHHPHPHSPHLLTPTLAPFPHPHLKGVRVAASVPAGARPVRPIKDFVSKY